MANWWVSGSDPLSRFPIQFGGIPTLSNPFPLLGSRKVAADMCVVGDICMISTKLGRTTYVNPFDKLGNI